MCTYETAVVSVSGAGKTAGGWIPVTEGVVYFDHPVSAPNDHTLNIDVRNPAMGAAARVALELEPSSARRLAEAILSTLDAAPPGLVEPAA